MLLNAGADGKVRDRHGRTTSDAAAQVAAARDRAIILDMLWKSGQTVRREHAGTMPWSLEHSVMRRQTDVTTMLLAMGADPNGTGTAGTTPLADAALKGDLEGVRALMPHGARLNAVSQAGTQPIHDAALSDSAEVIRELVAQGADVNARTRDERRTPLHTAATRGKLKAVEALLALGADVTIRDRDGRTALETAERVGLTEVAALLRRVTEAE